MGYDNRSIVLHELIGLQAEVVNSSDIDQIGVSGMVVDETKNTIVLEMKGGARKSIVKQISTFRFSTGGKSFVVDGREIGFRPFERTEKALKFYKMRKA